jgi:hypothetical protein
MFAWDVDFDESFKDDIEGSGSVSSLEDNVLLLVLEGVHVVADGVPLLGGEVFEDGDLADVGFGYLVVILNHFALDAQEDVLAEAPKHAFLSHPH